jgi:uncharacterized membrane protein required for colicin V production
MNGLDVALVLLLLLAALRGAWRGVFRETFGCAALVLGLAAALRGAEFGASWLTRYPMARDLSPATLVGVAFVAVFLAASTALNLIGVAADQVFGRGALRIPSRIAGALFALAKSGAALALVLLFLHLFPIAPAVDQQITGSRLARPMVSAATAALRAGWRNGAADDRPA